MAHHHTFILARLWLGGIETLGWLAAVALIVALLWDRAGGHRLLIFNVGVFCMAEVFFHVDVLFDVRRVGQLDDWFWSLFKVMTFLHVVTYAWMQYPHLRRTLQFSEAARLIGATGLSVLASKTPSILPDAKEEEHVELRMGTLQKSRSLRQQLEHFTTLKGDKHHAATVGEGLAGSR